jgi:ribosome biogenesis GTPase / thiamine phosphate phosphatase
MTEPRSLVHLGFGPRWQALFEERVVALAPLHASEHLLCGRVVRVDRGSVLVTTAGATLRAAPSVRSVKAADAGPPVTGDWVVVAVTPGLDTPLIEAVLERATAFTRGDPDKTSKQQVLAANVDIVFVMHSVSRPPNLRRIERELAAAWESGATPVVVLAKADLSSDPAADLLAVESVAMGVDLHLTSAVRGDGVAALRAYGSGHRTIALIGPSGVGKSTLVNALIGEQRQATREVRLSDGRGRHTTVTRELIVMPGGGVLLDTPGMRALAMTDSGQGIGGAFADIETLARSCRFGDCSHTNEPGCAVRRAVEDGALSAARLASYQKLQAEARAAAAKTDARLRAEESRQGRIFSRNARRYYRITGKEP